MDQCSAHLFYVVFFWGGYKHPNYNMQCVIFIFCWFFFVIFCCCIYIYINKLFCFVISFHECTNGSGVATSKLFLFVCSLQGMTCINEMNLLFMQQVAIITWQVCQEQQKISLLPPPTKMAILTTQKRQGSNSKYKQNKKLYFCYCLQFDVVLSFFFFIFRNFKSLPHRQAPLINPTKEIDLGKSFNFFLCSLLKDTGFFFCKLLNPFKRAKNYQYQTIPGCVCLFVVVAVVAVAAAVMVVVVVVVKYIKWI